MIYDYLSKQVKIVRVSNTTVAGTGTVTSSSVDLTGYQGVCFVAALGTVTDASVIVLQGLENTTNTNSGGTNITSASATLTASTSSNTDLVVDVLRPSKVYAYCTLSRTTQNAGVNGIWALLYQASTVPVTQPTSVSASGTGGVEA